MELDPQARLICPVGGVILFSGQQMHSSVPNTSGLTRFSIDFRTVHLDDVVAKRGAPNIDSVDTLELSCGTTCRGRISRIPEEIVSLYDDGTEG